MAPKTEKSTFYIDIYDFHFFMYNMTGYTYVDHDVPWAKLLHAILHHIVCTILIFNNCMAVYMSFHTLSEPDDVLYVLAMTGMTIGVTLKICMMEYYKKKILSLHSSVSRPLKISEMVGEELANEERRKTEEEFLFITKAFYSLLPGSFAVFIILPVFFSSEKGIPYMFPVKNLPTPFYEIIYIVNGAISILFILNTISYDMICYGLLLRLSTNFKIISRGIKKFSELYPRVDYSGMVPGYSDYADDEEGGYRVAGGLLSGEETEFLTRLVTLKSYEDIGAYDGILTEKSVQFLNQVIRHHQEMRCEITLMDRIFNFNMFIQVVGGTGVLCLSAASLFSDHFNVLKDIRLSGLSLAGFIDLFLYCYCGSRCLQSEEDFRIELYSLPWYAMDAKMRKLLIFMLTRLQTIKGLTAGRMCNVGLDLFLGILKFSHSFIALLSES